MGRLPVDIWAVSNVEACGHHIEGNYVQYMCVLTCFFRLSEHIIPFDVTTIDLNITYRPYVHRQPTHTEPLREDTTKFFAYTATRRFPPLHTRTRRIIAHGGEGLRTPQHRILAHRNTHNTYSCPICCTYINLLRLQDNH